MTALITNRNAIRAVLLTPEADVLLMRVRSPNTGEYFWIAPGGGMEPGESVEAALRRELSEELGLVDFTVGPVVWRRQHTFDWRDQRLCQSEEYRIVRVARFEPVMSDEVEAQSLDQFRWWRPEELSATKERLTPLSLANIVADFLANGAPVQPLEIEYLVD